MKRKIIIAAFVMFFTLNLFGENEFGVDISSFLGISLTNADYIYNENEAFFNARASLSEDIFLFGSFGLVYTITPADYTSERSILGGSEILYPLEIYLDEAYIHTKNFILPGFDFVVGKQRIAWGKADKINPTDILNPVDLSKMTDLAKKIPSFALNMKYYLPFYPDAGIQLVWETYPNQAIIPVEFIDKQLTHLMKKKATNVTSFEIENKWSGEVEFPESNISNSTVGGKIFGKLYGFDFSINAVRRVNDIPYVKEIYLTNLAVIDYPALKETNVVVLEQFYKLDYHKETEVGFDISKDWGIFLNWIELSVVFPDETKVKTYTFASNEITNVPVVGKIITNTQITNEEIILKEPYVKFVLGLDKSFDGGWYINFQYAHGLFMERGYKDERLQDYLTFNLEKSFFDDKLKLKLFGIANVDNFLDRFKDSDIIKSFADNGAIIGSFEVVYVPVMGLEFKLGVMGIDGNGEATLARYKDYDMVYFEVKKAL